MKFTKTAIEGCMIVDVAPHADDRGFFARTWCREEFSGVGLPDGFVQSSMSRNRSRGTIRGLHFQTPPSREGKLVRCTRGEIFDVAVDIRASSESFLQHVSAHLTGDNAKALFIPPGCAHGFQVLEDGSDVLYMMTDSFEPDLAAGLRWNDGLLGIEWPLSEPEMNERDRSYPDADLPWLRSLEWQ